MLVTTHLDNAVRSVWLDARPVTIGRGPACHVILEDPVVADCHVRLWTPAGALVVENLAAPITVDGIALATNGRVTVGERRPIRIGGSTIVVQLQPPIVTTHEGANPFPMLAVNPPRPEYAASRPPPPRTRPRNPQLSTDPTEQQLLEALREAPGDATTRMVYADWLDERSLKAKFELLQRREHFHTFIHRKATTIDWRAVAVRAPIDHCAMSACPLYWDELTPTSETDFIRTCAACRQQVVYCGDLHDVVAAAGNEMRIVVDAAIDRRVAHETYARQALPGGHDDER